MRMHKRQAIKRSAMTLIEILVVIAIIGILASLLLGGVVAVRKWIPISTTRNDILQLSSAMDKFYAKYGFYPPDQIKLCSHRAAYGNTQLDIQSIAAITKMFPNIAWTTTPVAWDGSGNNNLNTTLQGDQALVFFLGGIPDPNGNGHPPQGFSTNPANPAAAISANASDRIKFMTGWDVSRIQLLHTGTSKHFPSYWDGFSSNLAASTGTGLKQKQPYMYFSSMSLIFKENGYDSTATTVPGGTAATTISPYIQKAQTATAPAVYWNSAKYQIVSAGPDGSFGPGGLWPPAQGHGMDDYSNFNGSVLASPD